MASARHVAGLAQALQALAQLVQVLFLQTALSALLRSMSVLEARAFGCPAREVPRDAAHLPVLTQWLARRNSATGLFAFAAQPARRGGPSRRPRLLAPLSENYALMPELDGLRGSAPAWRPCWPARTSRWRRPSASAEQKPVSAHSLPMSTMLPRPLRPASSAHLGRAGVPMTVTPSRLGESRHHGRVDHHDAALFHVVDELVEARAGSGR